MNPYPHCILFLKTIKAILGGTWKHEGQTGLLSQLKYVCVVSRFLFLSLALGSFFSFVLTSSSKLGLIMHILNSLGAMLALVHYNSILKLSKCKCR